MAESCRLVVQKSPSSASQLRGSPTLTCWLLPRSPGSQRRGEGRANHLRAQSAGSGGFRASRPGGPGWERARAPCLLPPAATPKSRKGASATPVAGGPGSRAAFGRRPTRSQGRGACPSGWTPQGKAPQAGASGATSLSERTARPWRGRPVKVDAFISC